MNHKEHKFFTTIIIFVVMIVSVMIASQFDHVSHSVLNTALMLVNSLLLLIIMGIVLHIKDCSTVKKPRRKP